MTERTQCRTYDGYEPLVIWMPSALVPLYKGGRGSWWAGTMAIGAAHA